MKKTLHISIFIVSLTSLGLVVSGCVLRKPQNNVIPVDTGIQNQEQNINTSTTTTKIDTSDWKIYRTKDSGLIVINSIKNPIEFKYPKDWYVTEQGGGILLTSYPTNKFFRDPDYEGEMMISFDVGNPLSGQEFVAGKSINTWCKDDLLSASVHNFDPEAKTVKVIERGYQRINNQLNPFLVYQYGSFDLKTRITCFSDRDEIAIVGYYYIGEGVQEIYDAIMSSIRLSY